MKEAKYSNYPGLIFREPFRSEAETIKNGGTPTDVDFSNGIGSFNGDTSNINYGNRNELKLDTENKSFRFRFKTSDDVSNSQFFYRDGASDNSTPGVYMRQISGSIQVVLGNGSSREVAVFPNFDFEANTDYELVICIDRTNGVKNLHVNGEFSDSEDISSLTGSYSSDLDKTIGYTSSSWNGSFDLFEVYNKCLTNSEVKNLYNDTRNKELSPNNLLLDFDSTQGVLSDKTVGNVVDEPLVNNDFDFTDGWTAYDGTIESSNTFQQSSSSAGVYKTIMTAGKKYRVHVKGNLSNSNELRVWDGSNYFIQETVNGDFDLTGETTVSSSAFYLTVQNNDNTLMTIDYLQLEEIRDDLDITDVTIKKQGAEFNGSSSKIDCGSDFIGTKAVTVMGWINFSTNLEGNTNDMQFILHNGKFLFNVSYNTRLGCYSDGTSWKFSANGSISLNKLQFVCVTRESDGTVNFYIGDKSTAPALSGSADQDSGTPEAGTTNVIIGNNDGQTRTFDGLIPKLTVIEGILDIDDITRYWSESRKHIE